MVLINIQNLKCYFISVSIILTSYIHNILIIPKDQISLKWNTHKQEIDKILNFYSSGSINFISSKRNFHTNFHWQCINLEKNKLTLNNLFFNLILDIDLKSKVIRFLDSKNECYEVKSIDDIEKQLQIMAPIQDIPKWLLGLPGSISDFSLYKNGNLKEMNNVSDNNFKNSKLKILYNKYYKNPTLPCSIECHLNDETIIKIKINKWII